MGLLSNRVERSSLKPGDHIYSWRTAYIYAHHGIYVGDNEVIHFTRRGQEVGSGTVLDVLLVSSSLTPYHVPCPTCVPAKEGHGVISSCLDCFLAGGILYRFEYSVSRPLFLAKMRGGTCTLADSDGDDAVIHRAKYLRENENGFGSYNIVKNNCEDFAIYCKTELLVLDQSKTGQSGQMSSISGSLGAVLGPALNFVVSKTLSLATTATTGVYGMAATAIWSYGFNRYKGDIGMRTDVVRVSVEDLPRRF